MKKIIVSILLALALLLVALPALAEKPEYDSEFMDVPWIWANGNDLFIEAGEKNGTTSVYYMNSGVRTALVENADLSKAYVLAGMKYEGATHDGNVTICMTGGSVYRIFTAHSTNGVMNGDVTIAVSGDATVSAIYAGSNTNTSNAPDNVTGNLRIFVASENTQVIDTKIPMIDGLVQKTPAGWNVSGKEALVPAVYTMEIESDTTVTVPDGAVLTNEGTITNNGTIILEKSFSQFQQNGTCNGSGSIIANLPYIVGSSAPSSVTASVNTETISNVSAGVLDGRVYIEVPQGKVLATIDGTQYYCEYTGSEIQMQTGYVEVTGFEGIPSQVSANTSTALAASVQPTDVFEQTVTYSIKDTGTTGATLQWNNLVTPFGGTVKLRVTASDGYRSFSKEFTVQVQQVAVTGISSDNVIPSSVSDASVITLPTQVMPADATYKDIEWTVSDNAVLSDGKLKLSQTGNVTLTATVKNGRGNGQDYIKTYTINVSVPDKLNIANGNIIIRNSENPGQIEVEYSNGIKKLYSADELISITGTTKEYQIEVRSGSPKLLLENCRIETGRDAAIDITKGPVEITLSETNYLKGKRFGIYVPADHSLTIDGNGTLTVSGGGRAAIGAQNKTGTITINGGTINATSGGEGYTAAIGGSEGGTVIINGGNVTATGGQYSAGIGKDVTINGGTVTAQGGENGAGIGSGYRQNGGITSNITINGGVVNATGGKNAAGIGSSMGYSGNKNNTNVTINGGTVTAQGGTGAANIGKGNYGNETVTITGGSVNAANVVATNGEANGSQPLSQKVLTIVGLGSSEAEIASAAGLPGYFGLNDVQTINKELYFYLPDNYPESVTTSNGKTYYHQKDGQYTDHQHNWNYDVSGNSITATCKNSGCSISQGNGGSVSLSVPTNQQIHTGSEIEPATISYSTDWVGSRELTVSYTNNTALGEATASLTLSNATLTVYFDIVAQIMLDANGGSDTVTSILTDTDGKLTANLPENVTHATQFFTGWYDAATGGNKVTDDTVFIGSMTIYAQFVDHEHSWTYSDETPNDAQITATCQDCAANGGNDLVVTLTLIAPAKNVYGDEQNAEATVTQSPANTITSLPSISYSGTKANGEEYAATATAPTDAGSYTAILAPTNDVSAQVEYAIAAKTLPEAVLSPTTESYNGSSHKPDVTIASLTENTDYTVAFPEDMTNAGSKTITVTGVGNYTGMQKLTYTISSVMPTANAPAGVTATYGQTLSEITLTNPEGNTPGEWRWENGDAAVGNAGTQTHKATFTPTDATNYQTLTGMDVSITVGKATPNVTAPTAKTLTYTGSAQELINAGTTDGGTLEYSLDGTNYSTNLPTAIDAGDYTVYYRVVGNDNYNDVTAASIPVSIAMATPVVTAPTALNLVYTGSTQVLINAGDTDFGTLEYSLDGETYSTELPTGTEAKTYTVYYRVPGTNNWNEVAAQTIQAGIDQNNTVMTMTPATQTVTYGMDASFIVTAQPEEQQRFSLLRLVEPAENQVAIFHGNQQLTEPQTVNGEELTFTINTKDAGLNAGQTYTLTAKYIGNSNMRDQTATADVTVAQAEGSGSVSITGWTYGTAANAPVPTTETNDVNAVTYLYEGTTNAGVAYSSESAPTEAGGYTVTATFAATTNYKAYTTAPVSFTIAKTDDLSGVTPTGLTAIYGHTLSSVKLPQNWSWVDSADAVGNKGNNKHKAHFAGDANHNAKDNVELVVAVAQSESILTADSDKDAYIYGNTVTIEAVLAQPQQTFSLLRAFTPAVSGQMAVYNGSTQISEAKTARYDEIQTFTLDTVADGLTPDSYTLTVRFIESSNMEAAECPVDFTVSWLDLTNVPAPTLPDGSTGSGEGQDGDGWYSGDVTLAAPDGYVISTDGGQTWGATGTIDTTGSPDGENTYDYQLQNTETGEIGTGSTTIQTDNTDPLVTTPEVDATDTTAAISAPATDESSGVAGSTLTQTSGEPAVTITNNGNGSFTITGMTPGEAYTFELTVTDHAGNTTTVPVTLTASPAPRILSPLEAAEVSILVGETAVFDVVAENAYRYEWYKSVDGGVTFIPTGKTTSSYESAPVTLENEGYQYFCRAYGESGVVYADSPIFTLHVRKPLPATGDHSQIGLWLAMCFISIAGMIAITMHGKKRRTE